MEGIAAYISGLLGKEIYSFTWEELRLGISRSEVSLRRELSRLVEKREIINLRRGFYLILPPRYRSMGQLPLELYVDQLFEYLDKHYYIGLYSAARLHGASHQQIHQNYIVIPLPALLNIERNEIVVKFYTSANWPSKNIRQQKSDAGYFNVSSPALTAVDLLHYQTKLGGLNRVSTVLEELVEVIQEKDIIDLLSWYPHTRTLQRLGYHLEENHIDKIITQRIFDKINTKPFYPILLSPQKMQKAGAVDNRWKVFANQEKESDL
jgi:predicted transcriptional regulator of viral defense system